MRKLDGVLQDLGFAPKPHPTIFIENEPEAVFDGLGCPGGGVGGGAG